MVILLPTPPHGGSVACIYIEFFPPRIPGEKHLPVLWRPRLIIHVYVQCDLLHHTSISEIAHTYLKLLLFAFLKNNLMYLRIPDPSIVSYFSRVAFRGGAGGHLLKFYFIYCNVQHVALALPPPWYAETAIFPPLEQNSKCSPVQDSENR